MTEIELVQGGDLATGGELAQNPAAVYLLGLAPGSRRAMAGALGTMAATLTGNAVAGFQEQLGAALAYPWHTLRYQDTTALRAQLKDKYQAATVNKMLSALRRVLKEAWRLRLMGAEEYARAADVGNVIGETLPTGRALSGGEIDALMLACAKDPTPAGARDGAMLAIMYSCGLRRAEVAALPLGAYDPESGALEIHGKRNKERMAYVVNGAADALADWLAIRGDADGPLFCPINKGGTLLAGRGLTSQAVYNMLGKRAAEAGIKGTSPHDLRRTFVGDLLDAGADISTVQRMAGHANVTTTARYDRRPEATKRKAAGLLHVPYRRRSA